MNAEFETHVSASGDAWSSVVTIECGRCHAVSTRLDSGPGSVPIARTKAIEQAAAILIEDGWSVDPVRCRECASVERAMGSG